MRVSDIFENSTRKIRIAIIEDSDIFRCLLDRFINEIGHGSFNGRNPYLTIFTYPNAEACMRDLDKIRPDIILLDYFLNGYNNPKNCMNGYEALLALKQLSPRTKIIMVSGQGDFLVKADLIDAGADAYVSKEPRGREELQVMVYKTMRSILAEDDKRESGEAA